MTLYLSSLFLYIQIRIDALIMTVYISTIETLSKFTENMFSAIVFGKSHYI